MTAPESSLDPDHAPLTMRHSDVVPAPSSRFAPAVRLTALRPASEPPPPGTKIDTSDMDEWRFPVGTKFWKEFAVSTGDGPIRVETRLIERLGTDPEDVYFGAFEWNEGETEAEFRKLGETNARDTTHDIPAASACLGCHIGQPHRVLA